MQKFVIQHDNSVLKVATIISRGSLLISACLLVILLGTGVSNNSLSSNWAITIGCVIVYFSSLIFFNKRGFFNTFIWGLILFYELLAVSILAHIGFSSIIGLFVISFILLLAGPLLHPPQIISIGIVTLVFVMFAYFICLFNTTGVISQRVLQTPTLLEVSTVVTILTIFTFISWLSAYLTNQNLQRAVVAEATVRKQKDILAKALEEKSTALRHSEMEQLHQLYRFAIVGQSATATLHELSNHLNILGLDITDFRQKRRHHKNLADAQESIQQMNKIVHAVRETISSKNEPVRFDISSHMYNVIVEFRTLFKKLHIKFSYSIPSSDNPLYVIGEPLNLTQVISILLKNAADACSHVKNPLVRLSVCGTEETISIMVEDNGPGIDKAMRKTLFTPGKSSKASGLGIGLYLAKQLIESGFRGTLSLNSAQAGTCFEILIRRNYSIQGPKDLIKTGQHAGHSIP